MTRHPMIHVLGWLATLAGLMATVNLEAPAPAQTAQPAQALQLHIGYQHVPRDGTGRLGGSAVDLFEVTRHNTVFWPTHVFAELFYTRTHDRYWRWIEGPGGGGQWALRPELMREYAALIDKLAGRCLDSVQTTLDGRRPASRIWVFVDLETATIKRRPYVEPEAEGYGSRDVAAMTHLCNRIQFLGGRRFGDRGSADDGPVKVIAAMYHPLRSYGHWAGISEPAPSFVSKWHGEQVWPLLDRQAVWIHNYTPEDPAGFKRQPQTHRQFTRANVRGQFEAILNGGARPDDVFVVGWFYTKPDQVEAEGIMLGVADVLAERPGGWPWQTHLVWCGDWGSLQHLVDAPVEKVSNPPLVLTIPADLAGYALADSWMREVEATWRRVFAPAAADAAR